MGALGKVSAKVLANKGVPIEVNLLKHEDGEIAWPPKPLTRSDDTPATEERFVRFGNYEIAELEEKYDGLDKWQEGLKKQPFLTINETLQIVWADELEKYPPRLRRRIVGAMLIDASMDDYSGAVGGAFMLANGIDPRAVGKALEQGIKATQKAQERLLAKLQIDQTLTDVELGSTMSTPSEAGAESVEASTSTGD